MVFLGTYSPRLDDKGRLALPAKFRPDLEGGLVICKGQERCLYVFHTAQFATFTQGLADAPITDVAMIGWDVALPGDEPVLLEMNLNWGIFNNTPFGSTRYVEIVHHWLDTRTPEVAAFMAAVLNS